MASNLLKVICTGRTISNTILHPLALHAKYSVDFWVDKWVTYYGNIGHHGALHWGTDTLISWFWQYPCYMLVIWYDVKVVLTRSVLWMLQPRPVLPLDKVELGFETPGNLILDWYELLLLIITEMLFFDSDDNSDCIKHGLETGLAILHWSIS